MSLSEEHLPPGHGMVAAASAAPREAAPARGDSTLATGVAPVFNRIDVLWLVFITLLALGIRVVYVIQMSDSPLFANPLLDAEVHDSWARMILDGESKFTGAYFKAPLYPAFLSSIYAVSERSYMAPRIAQAILGALSCALMYLLGREIFASRAVGAIAGLAGATYWIMIYFDGELLLEPLSVFLNLAAMLVIFRAARRDTLWLWAAAGLLLGLGAINRPNILPFIPVVALWALLQKGEWSRGIARAAVLGVASLVPILPITVRNYIVGKDLVLIASQGGPNFYIGNNPESNGMSARMPGARTSWGGGYADWITLAESAEGRKLKPSEVSKYFFDQSWEWIRSNKVAAVDLMFRKLQLFFWEGEIVNNQDMHTMTARFAPFVKWLPLTTGMILPLGLLGFFMCLGRGWRTFPLWTYVAIYTATVIAFFVCSRFRLPVMPFAILLGAFAVVQVARLLLDRQFAPLLGYAILLGLCWKGINRGVPEEYLDRERVRALCQLAGGYSKTGKTDVELALLNEALNIDKDKDIVNRSNDAVCGLGFYYLRKGDYAKAAEHFAEALRINPSSDVYEHLAEALILQGKWGEAIERLEEGLEVLRGYLDLKRKLAFVLSTCPESRYRDGRRALRLAQEVQAIGSEVPQTYDTLGVAYAETGNFDKALEAAQRALDLARQQLNAVATQEISARIELYRQRQPFRQRIP